MVSRDAKPVVLALYKCIPSLAWWVMSAFLNVEFVITEQLVWSGQVPLQVHLGSIRDKHRLRYRYETNDEEQSVD